MITLSYAWVVSGAALVIWLSIFLYAMGVSHGRARAKAQVIKAWEASNESIFRAWEEESKRVMSAWETQLKEIYDSLKR